MSGIRQLDHEPCRCPGFLFTMLARAKRSRSVASFEQRERVLRAPRQKTRESDEGNEGMRLGDRVSVGRIGSHTKKRVGCAYSKNYAHCCTEANLRGFRSSTISNLHCGSVFSPVGELLSMPEGYAPSRGNEAKGLSDVVFNISRW